MLATLQLINYRGFRDHNLDLRPLTVAVGHNNAGKSTVVEALRLISVITERLGGLRFREPPEWSILPLRHVGVRPSLKGLGIRFDSITHHYSDDPAQVIATFTGGESIHLFVNRDGECHAILGDQDADIIRTKGRAQQAGFPALQVLPQITPLEPKEVILTEDYIRRNLSLTLSSRHFRNQLRLMQGAYKRFRQMAEETWPEIQIRQLQGARGYAGQELSLTIRDRDFVAEVARMGHGLQMWLQTIWFLSRVEDGASVVLDEPDVYMHPDQICRGD